MIKKFIICGLLIIVLVRWICCDLNMGVCINQSISFGMLDISMDGFSIATAYVQRI